MVVIELIKHCGTVIFEQHEMAWGMLFSNECTYAFMTDMVKPRQDLTISYAAMGRFQV